MLEKLNDVTSLRKRVLALVDEFEKKTTQLCLPGTKSKLSDS